MGFLQKVFKMFYRLKLPPQIETPNPLFSPESHITNRLIHTITRDILPSGETYS